MRRSASEPQRAALRSSSTGEFDAESSALITTSRWTIREVDRATWSDFVALLGPEHGCGGCWCFRHHVPPCVAQIHGSEARASLEALVFCGEAHGLLAYDALVPVAWCAVDRVSEIPGHPCALASAAAGEDAVWAIHCVYVCAAFRESDNLVRELIAAAIDLVLKRGGTRIEAYAAATDDEIAYSHHAGPRHVYADLGFETSEVVGGRHLRMTKRLA